MGQQTSPRWDAEPRFSKPSWIWSQYPWVFHYIALSFTMSSAMSERKCLQSLNFLFSSLSCKSLPFTLQVWLAFHSFPDHPCQKWCSFAFQQWWSTPLTSCFLISHLLRSGKDTWSFIVISLFSSACLLLSPQLVDFSCTNLNIFCVLYPCGLPGTLHALLKLNLFNSSSTCVLRAVGGRTWNVSSCLTWREGPLFRGPWSSLMFSVFFFFFFRPEARCDRSPHLVSASQDSPLRHTQ